jgi:hypothetical protein
MIKLKCLRRKYSELDNTILNSLDAAEFNDPEYDFHLEKNTIYNVIGVVMWAKYSPRLYVIDHLSDFDVRCLPAVFFDFNWTNIPSEWLISCHENAAIEIIPKVLAEIDYWFHNYLEDDESVIAVVQDILHPLIKELAQDEEDRLLRELIRLNELNGFDQFDEVVLIQAIDELIPIGSKGIILTVHATTPKTYTVEFFKDQSISLGSFTVQTHFLLLDK